MLVCNLFPEYKSIFMYLRMYSDTVNVVSCHQFKVLLANFKWTIIVFRIISSAKMVLYLSRFVDLSASLCTA